MTKKGRWWWVQREDNTEGWVYFRKRKKAELVCLFIAVMPISDFISLTGLKLKPGEVRKVRLEWE